VVQRSNHPSFPFETLTETCGRDFDGHLAVQSRVGGTVDFTHATGRQETLNPIGTQALAGLQGAGSVDQFCRRCRGPGLEIRGRLVVREQGRDFTP